MLELGQKHVLVHLRHLQKNQKGGGGLRGSQTLTTPDEEIGGGGGGGVGVENMRGAVASDEKNGGERGL